MGFLYLLLLSVGISLLLQDKSKTIKQQSHLNVSISLGALIVTGKTKSAVVLPTVADRLCLRVFLEQNPILHMAICCLS